jgi:hypothetical protein
VKHLRAPAFIAEEFIAMFKKIFFLFVFFLTVSFAFAEEWRFNTKNDFFNNNDYPVQFGGLDIEADNLAVSPETFVYPYMWIANSIESTISKVDTRTNTEVGRYRTGQQGGANHNPSRTTVDKDGNVWVGNRDNSRTVVKIAGNINDCIDRNGNGIFDTSTGPNDIKNWGDSGPEDECVLLYTKHWWVSSTGPRALAVDNEGYIWVGIWANNMYYKLDPTDGSLISTRGSQKPYGAVIDGNGILWSANKWGSNANQKSISRINTANNAHLGYYTNFRSSSDLTTIPDSAPYGITVDKNNKVWFTNSPVIDQDKGDLPGGGFGYLDNGNLITFNQTHFDPAETDLLWYRGITVDNEGHIWVVAHTLFNGLFADPGSWRTTTGKIYRINSLTNEVMCKQTGFGDYRQPIGAVMDGEYNIWIIFRQNDLSIDDQRHNQLPGRSFKLDTNCQILGSVQLGKSPYTYSDATGAMLQMFSTEGWWKVTIFSSTGNEVNWSNISWMATNSGDEGFINVSLNFSGGGGAISYYMDENLNNENFLYNLDTYKSKNLTIYIKIQNDRYGVSPVLKNLVIRSYDDVVAPPNVDPVVPYEYCLSYAYGTQCSAQGVQDIRRTTAWVGISDPPNSCIVGDELIESGVRCGFMVLSFFSLISLIATILIIFIIYFVVKSRSKKKKKLNKKKPGRR